MGKTKDAYTISVGVEVPKERGYLGNLGVDGRIMKYIFNK
jgi:hypothetical protein